MLKGHTIFITGGAGFIAQVLIARLIDNNRIVVFDNFSRDSLTGRPHEKHPNLKIIRGDVQEYAAVEKCMAGSDIVIHCAAIAGVDTVLKDPVLTMHVNMIGTANVLKAANQHGVSGRVVEFSSSEVLGSMALNATELDHTTVGSAGEARWVYAVSKMAGEHLALAYYHSHRLPVVIVRPFNVYGPGQTGEGALRTFVRLAISNHDIQIHGEGTQIRAWCYVDDFADGVLRCMEDEKAVGETFNIGNARAVITTFGLAQTVCRVLNSKSKIVFAPPLSADIALRIPSVEKAERILGFKASIELEEGILKTAEWMLRNI